MKGKSYMNIVSFQMWQYAGCNVYTHKKRWPGGFEKYNRTKESSILRLN